MIGRHPGIEHIGRREWQASDFKDVSLFADSDLTCVASEDHREAFLEDAMTFWSASSQQIGRLMDTLRSRMVEQEV
jgi:hypothetical protein